MKKENNLVIKQVDIKRDGISHLKHLLNQQDPDYMT